MLKQNEDGTITDMMPKIEVTERSLLDWRKPTGHPQDMGLDDAVFVANGFGGRYSITPDSGEFLLWLDDDEFVWKKFKTVEKCKRYAECRFQKRVRDLYAMLKG